MVLVYKPDAYCFKSDVDGPRESYPIYDRRIARRMVRRYGGRFWRDHGAYRWRRR